MSNKGHPFFFEFGESNIRISVKDGIEIVTKEGVKVLRKHISTNAIFVNASRKSVLIAVKKLPFIGFLMAVIFAFIRVVKKPYSTKVWCIAIAELCSGASSIYSGIGIYLSLAIDAAITLIDISDSFISYDNHVRAIENASLEAASKNIAKMSLKEFVRIASRETVRFATGHAVKSATNTTISMMSKKVPFYGLFFGITLAANRVVHNSKSIIAWTLAVLEVISGLISLIPLIGTLISFCIDACITIIDISIAFIQNRSIEKLKEDQPKWEEIKIEAPRHGLLLFILSLLKSLIFYVLISVFFLNFILFTMYAVYGNKESCFFNCCNYICNFMCNLTGNLFCI